MSIRTDSNRNPSAIANIASDVITLNNYQVPSNVYAVAPNATHTFQTMSESNLDVSHSLFTNTGIESTGLESDRVIIAKGTITGSGNSAVINTLRGNLMSLSSLSGQNGQVANVQNVLLRNLNVSSYMYANSYTLPSISLSNGSGTFSKNVDVNGALQSNIVASNTLQASDVENHENVVAKDGNITNNMTTSNLLGTGFSIVNNSASFSNQVNMDGVSTITTLASDAMTVENETNQGAISQKNAFGSTLAYLTPTEITMAGTAEVMDESAAEHKIVRRFADVVNGVFEDDLNVTTLFASVDGISLLNSNAVNISDTLYVSSQYNHTTNDINTNGNLILTTNSAIASNVNITNTANINRRVFNSSTVSGNAVYADALFINQSAKMGNLNAGRVEAGSYNALRRITTTGNVESDTLTSNKLTGSGEFIFNANVDVNTLQAVDMNLNNTTIAFISSNSAGGNIDMANLNSYITSNVITGYTTANIISGNVVQDVVVGNVLANVKVGEVVVGNIYLGNILTEIIVSNTTANLIVGNLSTFLEIGNTVSNVVVGNISSNILVGNIEVIGIVGNISSNVITGNISSNIITGYTESNVIVGNTESQVFVGQTTTQVISGYTVENVITGNTTANVIIGTYEEEVLIGNTVANVIVGNVTANVISGYELANVIVGNVYANVVVGNITANIVVGNILGNIVIGNIEQTLVVGNTVGNGIVGNVYQSVVVGNIELSNVIVGNTVVPNVVIGNVITENVIIGNIVVPNVVIGNTYVTGVTGNIVGAGNANLNISNLTLSSVAITPVSVSSIWNDLTSGNLNGNIVVSKNIGTVSLPYSANSSSNIAASTFSSVSITQPLYSVCWSPELSIFVAGAYNGPSGYFFLTSPDGNTWTQRVSTADTLWTSVCWSAERSLFVAVANGRVATSPNGINWTARSCPSGSWYNVIWSKEKSLFVAVAWTGAATNSAVMTSSDGITWTSRTTPNNFEWQGLTWSPELNLFVSVAGAQNGGGSTTNNVMTSPDAITWTLRNSNIYKRWYSVAWSSTLGLFCAVGRTSSTSSIMTSPDGINWTLRNNPESQIYNSVIWIPDHEMFVAVAGSGTTRAVFSKDGINWYSMNTGSISGDFYTVAWAPSIGTLCAVNNNDATSTVMRATTGVVSAASSSSITETDYFLGNIISANILIGNILTENVLIGNTTANVIVGNVITENVIVGNIITMGIVGNVTSNISTNVYNPKNISVNISAFTYTAPPSNVNRRSVCWSPELLQYVAVASSGTTGSIITSTNGTSWTARTAPNTNNLTSVCWSSQLKLYVAVASSGTGNRVITSPDGITWTARSSIVDNSWSSVCWSPQLSLFVAVATNVSPVNAAQLVMTSSDGITWTIRDSYNGGSWSSVCWSPELGIFVAVSSTGGHVMTSSDGTTWTRYAASSSNAWTSVCWAPELNLFVAVANSGTNDRVMTSPDGQTWTSRTSSADYAWSSIAWANDIQRFYVVSEDTNSFMMTSTDAITWTLIGTSTFNTFSSICWAPEIGKICAVSSLTTTSNRIITHTNGIFSDGRNFTLSAANSLNILNNMNAYDWSGNLFVGVGSGSSNVIVSSPNGSTWTDQTTVSRGLYDKNWSSIAWSPSLNLYCAVASTGTGYRVMTSPDGTNWAPISTPADNNWTSVCWAPELNLFVAVASSGTGNRVMTSPDGSTWTLRTSAADNNWTSVTWAPSINLLCAVSSSGTGNRVMTSSDGITWTIRTSPANNTWNSIAWSPSLSLFCAVASTGTNNRIMTSPDGITWTTRNTNYNDFAWGQVIWVPEISKFYVSSSTDISDNVIATSSNGIDWLLTYPPTDTAYSWNSLAWSASLGKLYGIGKNSTGNISTIINTNSMISNNVYIPDDFEQNLTFEINNHNTSINFRAVAYAPSLQLFCAVGMKSGNSTSMAATSQNGMAWTARTTPSNNKWMSITWSPSLSLFVAVASATSGTSNIMTSPNGTTWTARTTSVSNVWQWVEWSPTLGIFVAMGSGATNNLITSTDGINWTVGSFTNPTPTNDPKSILWVSSLNMFVATFINANYVLTSTNGTTWTSRSLPITADWNGIAWSSDLNMLAICNGGSTINGQQIVTSTDGINWTLRSTPDTKSYSFVSICWSTYYKLFIVTSTTGTGGEFITSPDGINWSIYIPSNIDNRWAIIDVPELNMVSCVGNLTNTLVLKDNPFRYSYSAPSANINWSSVCWSPSLKLFCAVGDYQSAVSTSIMTSPNGRTWTTRTSQNTNNLTSVCWSPKLGIFCAVAKSGTGNRVTVSSTTGTVYVSSTSAADHSWSSVCWSDELSIFVAVSNQTNASVMTSSNGTNWTLANGVPSINNLTSVCWSSQLGIFVAVSSTGSVMTSSDGTTWTRYSGASSNAWQSVCWAPELSLFVAVSNTGTNNRVMTSPDGQTWTSRTSAANSAWSSITWTGDRFYVVCFSADTLMMVSKDGINWSLAPTLYSNYTSICYSPELGQICAVATLQNTSNRVLTFSSAVLPNYRNFTLNTTNQLGNINALAWAPSLNTYTGLGNGTVNLIQDSYANVSGDSLITTTTSAYLSNNWKSVAYSSSLNLYVAVASSGSGNRIMTSSDGASWIPRTSPADNNWEKVIWVSELSIFVAVASSGSSNRVMISPDGITWTLSTTPNNQWKSLAWSPTLPLLCAVGALTYTKPTTFYTTTNNKVAGVVNDMTPVADESRITAFSTYTSVVGNAPQYYSSGGYKNKPYIEFNSLTTGSFTDYMNIPSLALNMSTNGGFTLVLKVYVIESSFTYIPVWQSNDITGFSYNLINLSLNNVGNGSSFTINFTMFNGGSTTTNGTQILNLTTTTSYSFNQWYTITATVAATNGSAAEIYVDGVLSGSANISAALINRTNNYNYLGQSTTVNSQRFTGLYDSIFVYDRKLSSSELQTIYDYIEGTSGDNNSIMTSPNGVDWTSRSTNVDSNNVMSIAWSPKLSIFVAVGNNHLGNRIIRSPDGINWTVCDVSYDYQNWKNVVWVEDLGMFYVTSTDSAYDNVLLTSTDGITWSMTYPPTDARYTWKNFVWAQSLNKLYCFGEDANGNAAILSHTNQIQFSLANVSVSTPLYGNVSVPQYGNVSTPVYGNVVVPQYGNVLTGVYGNIITSLYGNVVIPKYDYSNSAIYGNIKVSTAYNTSNISISSNIISSNFNLTMPLYADRLSPIIGNVASPIYGNITIPEYGNIITPIYGNLVVPEYGVVYEPIYANVLVPVYGEVITPIYGNVIVPVYGQGYIPVYGNVEIPVYGNVLVPEYGFIQIPQYTEVTTPVYGNVIVPVYETQQFPIYGEEIVPIYTAVPTPIYSNIVEDVYQTIYTPIYQTSNVPVYSTIITPIYTEIITPIYGTILLPQYEEILTPIIEERITPIYQEVITPIYQEMVIPVTSYIYTPVYQDIVEPVYEDVLQPVYGKALLPVYTEVQIPIYSEVLVYVDPTAKTSSSKDIFTGSATVTNLLSFANGTVNNLFSLDSLYAPNLSLLPNPTTLATGNTTAANINVGNLIINPNYGDRVSITTLRNLSTFRNTNLTGQLVVGNISVNRNYISFASGQDFKPGNLSVDQTLFASSFVASTSNVSIQNISTLNNTSMIHVLDGANESNIRDNIIYTTNLTSNNGVSTVNLTVDGSAEVKNVSVANDAYVSGNIYARNGNMTSNLSAEYVIATDNMFISSNVSGTFTMPRTEAGNLTIKDTVRSNNIKSSSLQDILDLHAGNISSSKLYSSIDKLREVLSKDAQDNLYLGNYVAGNIYIGGPGAIAQTIYIGSALDTIYIGGDVANVFTTDTNVKDATIVINHGGSSYSGAGVEFEGAVSGSLTLDANGKFIFNDASGNVYSLTYIADGNFTNMSVNGAVLTSQNMSANVATVQKSLYNANHITAQTYENSGAMTTSTATASNTTSATLAVSSIHTSSAVAVAGTSTVSGNVIVSASTSTSSLTTSALETVDMSVLSAIQCANVAFYDFNGTNATITNGVVSASVNTHAIELHGGNLTTTNTLITKDVMLDNANISTRDATYDLRVKGSAHFGSKGSYDENNFGVFNITTSNVNPDPCISIVKEGSYVWNMGYDNASNDFVIYDGNVGVRLTAANSQSWSSVSDERFKKHIETLDEREAMERVMKGRGVYYNYLSDAEGSQRKVGFIAQELKEILPEVVDVPEKSEDPLTVRYQEITPLLIQALKGASKEVKELKTQIAAIKAKRA